MLFSIVVPVYNVEKYLEECLDSIMSQVTEIEEGCEVILVDDGSTDSSGEICDRYCKKYQGIVKVFHNTNHGLLYTRRFGYKQTCGEYIVNCDSDDCLEPEALTKLKYVIAENDNPDMIFFNQYLYKDGSKTVAFKDIFTEKENCKVAKADVLREYLKGYSIISVCCSISKRECIDIENGYENYGYYNNGEDSIQKLELLDNADTFAYINEALYDYRMGSGMTGKYDPEFYHTFKHLFQEIERRKENWKLSDFDEMVAVKTLFTTGRAITQSRYGKYENTKEQIDYLKRIREDTIFCKYIGQLYKVKSYLQKDHVVLLCLLKKRFYRTIVLMLKIKNMVG